MQNSLHFSLLQVLFFPPFIVCTGCHHLSSLTVRRKSKTAKYNLKATWMEWGGIFHHLLKACPISVVIQLAGLRVVFLLLCDSKGQKLWHPQRLSICTLFLPPHIQTSLPVYYKPWNLMLSKCFSLSQEHRNWLFTTENGHSKQNRNYILACQDAVAESKG